MGNRKAWLGILLSVIVVGGLALGVCAGPNVTCSCTKMSDTSVKVDVQAELIFYRYYEYYFSDGYLSDKMYHEATMSHTFTNISLDSFPLTVWVFLYFDEYSYAYDTHTEQSIDCAYLFAPEISVVANGATIPDGGTHSVVGEQAPGTLQLAYTIDNTAGVGDLIVDAAAAASLANCSGFTVDTGLPLTVGDGETGSLRVSITLDDPGAFGFELDISSNDPDTNSYSFDVSGSVMTPEQVALGGATRQLMPTGSGADGVFLDCPPVLNGAGDPVMAGYLPLAGIYHVGETVTGAAMVCDAAGAVLRSGWIYAHVYAVDLETRPASSDLLKSWMIRFDPASRGYPLAWSTEGMAPGIYDIYLSIGSRGTGQTLRVRLDEPHE